MYTDGDQTQMNIPVDVAAVTSCIAATQNENGEIPWSEKD